MKKRFLRLVVFVVILLTVSINSVFAERYTKLPVTMAQKNNYSSETLFTLNKFTITGIRPGGEKQYHNTIDIELIGRFNTNAENVFKFQYICYDINGSYLSTVYHSIKGSESNKDLRWVFSIEIPDVTAAIELFATNAGSWDNRFYRCEYENVYSDDGRVIGIPDLLIPAYTSVGWHTAVNMYSSSGEKLAVPYNLLDLYKQSGWYTEEDYSYKNIFLPKYNMYMNNQNYEGAFNEIEQALGDFAGTQYESGLYSLRTSSMDAWRKKINGPLAFCSYTIDNNTLYIDFRNVSYKTIVAFKITLDCYDIFGQKLNQYYEYYYYDNTNLESGKKDTFYWSWLLPTNTDYISNLRVTQVVYSDRTSWYR